MSYQRVKYRLYDRYRKKELWLTHDPMDWDNAEKTLKRSTKTYGIFTELSKNLGFTEEARDFLILSRVARDIEADVILEEWRAYPTKDGFYLHSVGNFDFSKYKIDEIKVNVQFKTGGLNTLIKAQGKEKFEIDRLEAINGNVIDTLSTRTVALTPREIMLVSNLRKDENSSSAFTQTTNTYSRIPSLKVEAQSDVANIQNTLVSNDLFTFATVYNNFENFFYLKSDVAKTITVRVNYDISVQAAGASTYRFKMYIYRYSFDGTNYNYEQLYDLVNPTNAFTPETQYSGEIDQEIILALDDSLLFVVEIVTNTATSGQSIQYFYGFENILSSPTNDLKLTVSENSQRESSQTETVLMHDVGEKLLQIITGEKLKFYSEFYGRKDLGYSVDGNYAFTGLSLGFWIRQFEDKKMEISLDQFLNTSNVIHNTGYSVETINESETLVVEDMKYFFQNVVTVRLPNQVSDVERSIADTFYYSNAVFGYKQPSGDNLYEEAMGLDEYNTQSGFTMPITRVDKKYTKLSDARTDSYGLEFARRKPVLNFPTQDTRYDKSIFALDLKEGLGLAFEQRLWADDFEQAPTGVFSPDTAYNLRLSPSHLERRHQWFYGSGLKTFSDEYVRFSNSKGNSFLSTKKTGENARMERDNVLISDLERARFKNEWITFTHEVDFDVNSQLYGRTEISGRQVPNFYGKVEFVNEFGLKEYGYIFEVQPNNEGKWKILKAL